MHKVLHAPGKGLRNCGSLQKGRGLKITRIIHIINIINNAVSFCVSFKDLRGIEQFSSHIDKMDDDLKHIENVTIAIFIISWLLTVAIYNAQRDDMQGRKINSLSQDMILRWRLPERARTSRTLCACCHVLIILLTCFILLQSQVSSIVRRTPDVLYCAASNHKFHLRIQFSWFMLQCEDWSGDLYFYKFKCFNSCVVSLCFERNNPWHIMETTHDVWK